MHATAIVLQAPEKLELAQLSLDAPDAADVVVDVAYSGISTGTERLLWSGKMPAFPGMGYPLVPGYESVGVVRAGRPARFGFRGPARRCLCPAPIASGRCAACSAAPRIPPGGAGPAVWSKLDRAPPTNDDRAARLGRHRPIMPWPMQHLPDLIVGHGVLGRLDCPPGRASAGATPIVWETNPGAPSPARTGYHVSAIPDADDCRRDYTACIIDVSGDAGLLDTLIGRVRPRRRSGAGRILFGSA